MSVWQLYLRPTGPNRPQRGAPDPGGVTGRRGANAAARIASRSISGIGMPSVATTALASSL